MVVRKSDAEVLELLHAHFRSRFPKACNRCERVYPSLHDYVTRTRPLHQAISYDLDIEEGDQSTPIGAAVFANCICGNTLALATSDLPVETRRELIAWARDEIIRRKWTPEQFLNYIRDQLRERVLANPPD